MNSLGEKLTQKQTNCFKKKRILSLVDQVELIKNNIPNVNGNYFVLK